ncbi:uncharacterized protein ACWYII_027134 isoform 1-T1 [Salvelinus alpinus]
MMDCVVVTGVLLVILLFHPPAAQMESPDTDVEAVRLEEFCLKISDDSHCTTAEPEPRQTVTNKEAAERTQLAMSSPSDDKEDINSTLQPAVNSSSLVANFMDINSTLQPAVNSSSLVAKIKDINSTLQPAVNSSSLVAKIKDINSPLQPAVNSPSLVANVKDGNVPKECCFTFNTRKIPRKSIRDYEMTRSDCSKRGVILVTKKNFRFCANPDEPSIEKIMKSIDESKF